MNTNLQSKVFGRFVLGCYSLLLGVVFCFGSACVDPYEPTEDMTPLEVVETEPVDGAIGVELDTTVRVLFSKPLLLTSVTPYSLRVSVVGGEAVEGEFAFSEDEQEVTFNPERDLLEGRHYQVAITRSIQDSEGQPLWVDGQDSVMLVRFQTEAQAPLVLSISPADGSEDVPSSLDRVSVTFSKPMDAESLHEGSFFLYDVQGEVVCDPDGRGAQFILREPLLPNRIYMGLLTTTVRDDSGLALEEAVPFEFYVVSASE